MNWLSELSIRTSHGVNVIEARERAKFLFQNNKYGMLGKSVQMRHFKNTMSICGETFLVIAIVVQGKVVIKQGNYVV